MEPFDLRLWPEFIELTCDTAFPIYIDQIVIDSRRIDSKNSLFVALKGSHRDGHQFILDAFAAGARYVIAKKGFQHKENPQILTVEDPLKSLQSLARCYRKQFQLKTAGIVGSYGKTMAKDLIYQLLKDLYSIVISPDSFNSQIGVPLSIFNIEKKHHLALIEAGFSLPGEMKTLSELIAPTHGIVTHIGKKHLSTLTTVQHASEIENFLNCPTLTQWILLPKTDLLHIHAHKYFWDIKEGLPHAEKMQNCSFETPSYIIHFPDGCTFSGNYFSGHYYFLDLLNIAVKTAWLFGASSTHIARCLERYSLEPTRTEIWKTPSGPTLINDFYQSDPLSIEKSLSFFKLSSENSRKIFIFSGTRNEHPLSQTDYKKIGESIRRCNIDHLISVEQPLPEPLIENLNAIKISHCASYNDALNLLKNVSMPDDTILLKWKHKLPLNTLISDFQDAMPNNFILINLAAVESNLQILRNKLSPHTRIMVVVKASAYGTDDAQMCRFLDMCGIDIVGVSHVDEGVALRKKGIYQDIFVINAIAQEAKKIVQADLEVGVSEIQLISSLEKEAEKAHKQIKVHLHIDTGMGRLGCRPEHALPLAKLIKDSKFLILEGVMTHFACADDPSQDPYTYKQAEILKQIHQELMKHKITPRYLHAANSSGAIRFHFPEFNMVRIGLAAYGLYSSRYVQEALELHLAPSLISKIVGINTCLKGETISYNRSYKVEQETQRIAVLPIGYFDGLHRNYSGQGYVLLKGQRAQMVGNICMDYMMIDITHIPDAQIGDPVLIFGEDEFGHYLPAEEFAKKGNSIVHELITCLGPRIQRIFIYEDCSKKRIYT